MNATNMQLDEFTAKYKPTDAKVASEALIKSYSQKLPSALIELWKTKGLGKYNDGLIEIINPEDFEGDLERTLGKKVPNYVPIAMGAFGDLFYYRKLTDTDEDVCVPILIPNEYTFVAGAWLIFSMPSCATMK